MQGNNSHFPQIAKGEAKDYFQNHNKK